MAVTTARNKVGPKGDPGKDGLDGIDGADGKPGESIRGPRGKPGKDGVDGKTTFVQYTGMGGGTGTTVVNNYTGGATYQHTQVSASTSWTVNHNLGFKPVLQVYDSGGNVMEAEIVHVSINLTMIYFAVAVSGIARCV